MVVITSELRRVQNQGKCLGCISSALVGLRVDLVHVTYASRHSAVHSFSSPGAENVARIPEDAGWDPGECKKTQPIVSICSYAISSDGDVHVRSR